MEIITSLSAQTGALVIQAWLLAQIAVSAQRVAIQHGSIMRAADISSVTRKQNRLSPFLPFCPLSCITLTCRTCQGLTARRRGKMLGRTEPPAEHQLQLLVGGMFWSRYPGMCCACQPAVAAVQINMQCRSSSHGWRFHWVLGCSSALVQQAMLTGCSNIATTQAGSQKSIDQMAWADLLDHSRLICLTAGSCQDDCLCSSCSGQRRCRC